MVATLDITGKSFELKSFNYTFSRGKTNGQAPTGSITYGEVAFSFDILTNTDSDDRTMDNTTFQEFISEAKNRQDIVINYRDDNESAKRTLDIKKAAIVSLSEEYTAFEDQNSGGILTVNVVVCSPDITNGGKVMVEGNWS